jgi:hypothetical protein
VRRGLPVAIVTRGTTRGDRHADLKVDAALGEILPVLATAAGQAGRRSHDVALAG